QPQLGLPRFARAGPAQDQGPLRPPRLMTDLAGLARGGEHVPVGQGDGPPQSGAAAELALGGDPVVGAEERGGGSGIGQAARSQWAQLGGISQQVEDDQVVPFYSEWWFWHRAGRAGDQQPGPAGTGDVPAAGQLVDVVAGRRAG